MASLTSVLLPTRESTFTIPTIIATILLPILLFTLIGPKNLPFAHTIRLLPVLYRIFKARSSPASSSPSSSSTTSSSTNPTSENGKQLGKLVAHPKLFTHHTTTTRAYLPELDVNIHKSNSTFFTDADVSRAELLSSLLGHGLANVQPASSHNGNSNSNAEKGKGSKAGTGAMFLLASIQTNFLRPIAPLQKYEVTSRILTWESEENKGQKSALYTVTYFLRPGTSKRLSTPAGREVEVDGGPAALIKDEGLRRAVFAVMITRYVFKKGRESISPERVLMASGLLRRDDGDIVGGGEGTGTEEWLDGETLEKTLENGMEYVAGCML